MRFFVSSDDAAYTERPPPANLVFLRTVPDREPEVKKPPPERPPPIEPPPKLPPALRAGRRRRRFSGRLHSCAAGHHGHLAVDGRKPRRGAPADAGAGISAAAARTRHRRLGAGVVHGHRDGFRHGLPWCWTRNPRARSMPRRCGHWRATGTTRSSSAASQRPCRASPCASYSRSTTDEEVRDRRRLPTCAGVPRHPAIERPSRRLGRPRTPGRRSFFGILSGLPPAWTPAVDQRATQCSAATAGAAVVPCRTRVRVRHVQQFLGVRREVLVGRPGADSHRVVHPNLAAVVVAAGSVDDGAVRRILAAHVEHRRADQGGMAHGVRIVDVLVAARHGVGHPRRRARPQAVHPARCGSRLPAPVRWRGPNMPILAAP